MQFIIDGLLPLAVLPYLTESLLPRAAHDDSRDDSLFSSFSLFLRAARVSGLLRFLLSLSLSFNR